MNEVVFGDRLLALSGTRRDALLRRIAEKQGFAVELAADARALLRRVRKCRPGIVVLDLTSPTVNPKQLLRSLAAEKPAPQVILIGGADQVQLARRCGLSVTAVPPHEEASDCGLERVLAGFGRVSSGDAVSELRGALARDELFLEYHPEFTCDDAEFIGFEALPRWRHPVLRGIAPDRLFWAAQEAGLTQALTDRVAGLAAAEAAAWREHGFEAGVAVNISSRDLDDVGMPERLARTCRGVGSDPRFMTIELSEDECAFATPQTRNVLAELQLRGFRLSLAEFSGNYASLLDLQRLPFSEVKIDRWLVQHAADDPSCRVMVEMAVAAAKKLGLRAVASGTESARTLQSLRRAGAKAAPGRISGQCKSAIEFAPSLRSLSGDDAIAVRGRTRNSAPGSLECLPEPGRSSRYH